MYVLQPAPGPYDHSVDEREHTVDQWKDLIYQEVMEYEMTHNPANTLSGRGPSQQASSDNGDEHVNSASSAGAQGSSSQNQQGSTRR